MTSSATGESRNTLTKRALVLRIWKQLGVTSKLKQEDIAQVVQAMLDQITNALANGNTVELRKFGVLKVEHRKPRIGRNPKNPSADVLIPERRVVKFKSGKEMKKALAD